MRSLDVVWNLSDINLIINIIKLFFMININNYIIIKIVNPDNSIRLKKVLVFMLLNIIISTITSKIKIDIDSYWSLLFLIISLSILYKVYYKITMLYSLFITIISFSINYVIYIISVMLAFFPNIIFYINNDWIRFFIILIIYFIIIYKVFKLKRLKYGLSFLNRKLQDTNFRNINFKYMYNYSIYKSYVRRYINYIYKETSNNAGNICLINVLYN